MECADGLARAAFPGTSGSALAEARLLHLDVVPLPDGSYRIYDQARRPDESHELRTELIKP
jgi:hypothetical protein